MKIDRTINKCLVFLVLLLLGLVPIVWFWGRAGVLINGVDTNFPLNPLVWFNRRFFVWNNTLDAGVDFSSSTAGFFFHLIQVIPYLLGFSLQAVQIISLVFWFALIVFSSYLFARTILPRRFLWQLLFVVFYSFNIYLFNSWENVKVANLAMMSAIPLALSILTLLREGKLILTRALLFSALIGVVVSGAGINPAYFMVLFIILFIYFLGLVVSEKNRDGVKKRCWEFLTVSLVIVLVNSFWLIPTVYYITTSVTPGGSLEKIGFPNWINSLSEHTSLLNVLRMQGAWDWYSLDQRTGLPLYIPYALNFFYKLPFIVFSFLIPLVAFLAFLLRDKEKNYLYLSFGLMLILGVFLGAGTHPPSGYIFAFFLKHIPFFSLFRSPWYIFTPLVCLSIAGLVALFFASIDRIIEKLSYRRIKFIGPIFALVLIIGNLFYCYPLVTGKIFRPARKDGFYIRFPAYVFEAEKWLASTKIQSRVIEYPDTNLVEFTWGYRGIESILNLFSEVENLVPPLNDTESNIARLIDRYYSDLKRGAFESTQNLAHKIGAGYLLEKRDVGTLALILPQEIKELPNKSFADTWFFYKILENPTPKFYSVNQFAAGYPWSGFDTIMSIVSPQTILLNPNDNVVQNIGVLSKSVDRIVLADNSQAEDYSDFVNTPSKMAARLLARDLKKVDYLIEIPEAGEYRPALERYKIEDFGINKEKDLEVEVDGQKSLWKIEHSSDSYVYFDQVSFKQGKHKVSLAVENKNLVPGGDFQGNINYQEDSNEQGKATYAILGSDSDKYLSILNLGAENVSANFPVSSFDALTPYYIEIKYQQIYGDNAMVLVGQNNKQTLIKTQIERLPNYPEWVTFSFYYEPVKTNSEMKVMLSAPLTKDPLGTKVYYDNLAVYKVFTNNLLFIKNGRPEIAKPEIKFQKISPVKYKVKVSQANGPHVLIFSENYSPEWQISFLGNKPQNFRADHFSANLFANAWYLENTPAEYELEVYYRPQRFYYLGAGLAMLTFVLLIIINGIKRKEREHGSA